MKTVKKLKKLNQPWIMLSVMIPILVTAYFDVRNGVLDVEQRQLEINIQREQLEIKAGQMETENLQTSDSLEKGVITLQKWSTKRVKELKKQLKSQQKLTDKLEFRIKTMEQQCYADSERPEIRPPVVEKLISLIPNPNIEPDIHFYEQKPIFH